MNEHYGDHALQIAYDRGYACGLSGPNEDNCHFTLFATPDMTKAWEHGKRDGEAAKGQAP